MDDLDDGGSALRLLVANLTGVLAVGAGTRARVDRDEAVHEVPFVLEAVLVENTLADDGERAAPEKGGQAAHTEAVGVVTLVVGGGGVVTGQATGAETAIEARAVVLVAGEESRIEGSAGHVELTQWMLF